MRNAPVQERLPACPWLNASLGVSRRLQMLLPELTLAEKISLLHGVWPANGYGGLVPGISRLCIPALRLQDGPAGVSDGANGVTALPAPVAAAATWNTKLIFEYGKVIGEEARIKGINVLFGPMVNIQRDPRWGRAWETFGEDPYVNGVMGVAVTKGIQAENVIATIKHVAAYDQDQGDRGNSIVGMRALHEIYLPAFYQAIVNGDVGAAMTTGGKVNNLPANANPYLLKDTLEERWGFKGFIISDYDGARSADGSANAGLDLSMPNPGFFGKPLLQAIKDGQVPMTRIDDMVSSILREELRFHLFNQLKTGSLQAVATSAAHTAIATQVAEESVVLLKNADGALPLVARRVRSIAVIGAAGSLYPRSVGCGSAQVNPPYVITPLQGIKDRAGLGVTLVYEQGSNPAGATKLANTPSMIAKAVHAARESEVAIVFADDLECEGGGKAYGPAAPPAGSVDDRLSISLSSDQDALISAVAAANPHTIVVLNTGAPVAAPWLGSVSALLQAWYPGQVDGRAIASVLFGDVDPSGHTVQTWPANEQQMPTASRRLWPGLGKSQQFSDGIFVGYRFYDAHRLQPLFPFGYGLSYTTFAFSDLRIEAEAPEHAAFRNGQTHRRAASGDERAEVSAVVTNTGKVAGADVVQVYVGDPAVAGEPPRQLKDFQKVSLQPGASMTVHFALSGRDLAYWKDAANTWTIPEGKFQIFVGDSSSLANLPLRGSLMVRKSVILQPGSRQASN